MQSAFAVEMARDLGLVPFQVYFYRLASVIWKIKADTDKGPHTLLKVDSPACGYEPGASGLKKGYVIGGDSNEYVLTTNLYYVEYDISGRTYNSYYPYHPTRVTFNWGVLYYEY